jgi:hypothetical protein
MISKCLLASALCFLMGCATQTPTMEMKKGRLRSDGLLTRLLQQYPQFFDTLLRQNDQWKIRIIYTRIDRKKNNRPVFTNYYFNPDHRTYFYPASTVKMPAAFLALQKLNDLNLPGLDKHTTMITEAAYPGQTRVYNDPSAEDGRPTIAHYIRKIFLASDNDAFNRLYEFLGQEYFNNTLHAMGYESVQVIHRLDISLPEDANRRTNPITFYDSATKPVYDQPMAVSRMEYQPRKTFLGKGYYSRGVLVNQPFDFSMKNRFTLPDLHSILESVLFPEALPSMQRFHLTSDDYNFLYRYMSMKPRESRFPQYDSSYSDAYVKFLLFGGSGPIADPDLRSFNKPGDAYGFLTDVAYIVDFRNGVEFILSATIACNSDGIFNDDHYDYETVGLPFMKNLGRVIYDLERQRKKKNIPDLSKFKMDYGR